MPEPVFGPAAFSKNQLLPAQGLVLRGVLVLIAVSWIFWRSVTKANGNGKTSKDSHCSK